MFSYTGPRVLTSLQEDEWTLLRLSEPALTPDGWDTMEAVLAGMFPGVACAAECAQLGPMSGGKWQGWQPLEDLDMWARQVRFTHLSGALYQAHVTLAGQAGPRDPLETVKSGVEHQGARDIMVRGVVRPKLRASVPILEYVRTYIVTNTAVATGDTGKSGSPPNAPDPPTSPWLYLAEDQTEYREPNGWVLMDRAPEYLPGVPRTRIALVRDTWAWVWNKAPG